MKTMGGGVRALVLATVLAGSGAGGAQAQLFGPRGPAATPFAARGAADAAVHTTVQDLGQLKGLSKVVVAQFQVEFVELSQGLAGSKRDNVKMDYAVTPLADAERQALTDKLYARFRSGLEAQGLAVSGWEALNGATAGAKLQKAARPAGELVKTDMGRMRIFTAGATPYYFLPGDLHLGSGAMGWAFSNAQMGEAALAFETGAAVMRVRMVVGLRDVHRSSKAFAAFRTASSMIGEPQLVVQGLGTELLVTVPGRSAYDYRKPAAVRIKDDLLFEEDLLEGRARIADGAGGTASNLASKALFVGGVLGAMAGAGGGVGLHQSHRVECTPDPAAHLAALERNLTAVQDMMLARFQAAL